LARSRALASVRPDHLTAEVIKALLARNEWLDPARIADVYWGAANQAGEDNRNVARMGVLLAGLPVEVPGTTVNRLCGSGMEAVASAARPIAAGEADIMLAGGSESMTRAPFVLPRASEPFARESGVADTRLGWRLVSPLMQELYPPISLGETAENVAERYGVSRERQDQFALRSHQRAGQAQDAGRFGDEIVPVPTQAGPVIQDEGIRPGLTLEELTARRPAFRKGGTVTGGNSSPLNDGAAGLLLVSERMLSAGVTPLARYEGTAAVVAPKRRPARRPGDGSRACEPVTSAADPAVGPAAECSDRLLGERESDRPLLVHLRVQGLIVQCHRRARLQEDAGPLGLDHLVPGYRAVGQRHLEGRSALVLRHDAQAGLIRQFRLGGEVADSRHGTVGQCEHEMLLCSIGCSWATTTPSSQPHSLCDGGNWAGRRGRVENRAPAPTPGWGATVAPRDQGG
jgi:acetyl-CoA acetyltransferase family protein